MSFNLTCEQCELYQTPTHMTFAILSYDEAGVSDGGWEGVRDRYLMWLCSMLPPGGNLADQIRTRMSMEEHAALLRSFDYLEFSYV